MQDNQSHYMQEALSLASLGRLSVSPNPLVGCVIVKEGVVVGRGYHRQAGGPHAEVFALLEAGEHARGSTVYVTLEPCCHFGRTPPCVDALIKAQVAEVVVAVQDQNPLVSGRGITRLQKAGINVTVGVEENAACEINKIFFHVMKHNRPYVIAKWAMSLDGKTITHQDDDRVITNIESQKDTHLLRQQVDAILIGKHTAMNDNPLLTNRYHENCDKQPLRIVLASKGDVSHQLNLFKNEIPGNSLLVCTQDISSENITRLKENNIDFVIIKKDKNNQVNLQLLLNELKNRNINSLLVEGGMTVHHAFMQANLIDEYQVYVAPIIIGSLNQKRKMSSVEISSFNNDIKLTVLNEEIWHV